MLESQSAGRQLNGDYMQKTLDRVLKFWVQFCVGETMYGHMSDGLFSTYNTRMTILQDRG